MERRQAERRAELAATIDQVRQGVALALSMERRARDRRQSTGATFGAMLETVHEDRRELADLIGGAL